MPISEINNLISFFITTDVQALKREGRDVEFLEIHPIIVDIFNQVKILNETPEFWDSLPVEIKNNIRTLLENVKSNLEQIQSFNIQQPNHQIIKTNIESSIRNLYVQLFTSFFQNLKIFVLQKKFSSSEIEKISLEAQNEIRTIQKQKEKVDEVLKAVQEASGKIGVSKFAGIFEEESKKDKNSAGWWLFISIIATLGIGWYLVYVFDSMITVFSKIGAVSANTSTNVSTEDNLTFSMSFQLFIGRVLLLSFFSVAYYQILKNYNAKMHLFTLNKHRANSLKTFQSFVEGTNDSKIKDAVLIQAARSIFDAGQTGYISSKDGGSTGIDTIKIFDQIKPQ